MTVTDDGSRAAVSSDGLGNREQIEVWDLKPEPKMVREIPGVLRALSPDGTLLARTGMGYRETEVVDSGSGAVVCLIPDTGLLLQFTGPDRLVMARHGDTRPGGDFGPLDVNVYDVRSGKREIGFEIPGLGRADLRGPVSGRRQIIVGWGTTGRVEAWDLEDGKMVHGVNLPTARSGGWDNFEASPDGTRVTAQRGGPVGVYDTTTGIEIATTGQQTASMFVPGRDLILGHHSWIGKAQAYSGWRAYDLTKKAIVADLTGAYLSPAISADGRILLAKVDRAAADLLVWDLTLIP